MFRALSLASASAARASLATSAMKPRFSPLVASFCSAARLVKKGDSVKVHYKGTFEDGEQFDSSHDRGEPLGFTVGAGQMIPGFDAAVVGMSVGDKKSITLPPAEAYGEYSDEYIVKVPATNAPEGLSPGDMVQLQNGQPAIVVSVADDAVEIDVNHPLAGRTLKFDVEMVDVQ